MTLFWNFSRTLVLFLGPLMALFWTSALGFKARMNSLACMLCHLSFTSGVTPDDLLVASMAAEPFWSTYMHTNIGGVRVQDVACCLPTICDKTEALPTEPSRLCSLYDLFVISLVNTTVKSVVQFFLLQAEHSIPFRRAAAVQRKLALKTCSQLITNL